MTFSELKAEIATRVNRDDLTDRIVKLVGDRIGHYRKEIFYSSQVIDTSILTVAGIRFYDNPSGTQQIQIIRLLYSNVWLTLTERPYAELLAQDPLNPSNQSLPTKWAPYGTQFRLGPGAPNGIYQLELTMDTAPVVPPTDGTTNFWTQEEGAQSLIINSTCAELFRTYITNPIRKAEFIEAEDRDELQLENKSIRLMGSIQIRPHW